MAEWWSLVPLMLLSAAGAGTLAGLLGVGGGIVIVPLLYHVFVGLDVLPGTAMQVAVGTSLASIIFTSTMSVRSHHARGTVQWPLVRRWLPFVLVGVVVGTSLVAFLPGEWLRSAFGVLLAMVAVYMFVTADHRIALFPGLPPSPVQGLLATVVGTFSSMLGIGGGTLVVPILSLYSVPAHAAVATAAVFGLVISLPAAVGYLLAGWGSAGLPAASTGFINWASLAALVPLTMLFAPLGARLAYRLNVTALKRVFAVFLAMVGIKMTLL